MAPVTEIARLPLITTANINDPSTPSGKIWQDTILTFSSQDGFQRAYYGHEVDDQSLLHLLIDWDTIEDHYKFMKSNPYAPFVKRLSSLLSDPASMYHAHLSPHPPTAAASNTFSPCTEVLTMYLDVSADTAAFEDRVSKMTQVLKDHAEGWKAFTGGWVVEELEMPGNEDPKAKFKTYSSLVGWESKAAQVDFTQTEYYKDNIHLLTDVAKKWEVHLCNLQQF